MSALRSKNDSAGNSSTLRISGTYNMGEKIDILQLSREASEQAVLLVDRE